jgi:(p)ppGpp synthase/HD superfamily hydrolase
MSHLMAVAAGVYELGGGPDEVLAALLHDVLEDQDVDPSEIEALAGPEVARIVIECSDSLKKNGPKAPWKERKLAALEKIKNLDLPSLRVVLADKLHNSRCIVRDLETVGSEALWSRFNAEPAELVWYYRSLASVFSVHPELSFTSEARELTKNAERMAQSLP